MNDIIIEVIQCIQEVCGLSNKEIVNILNEIISYIEDNNGGF